MEIKFKNKWDGHFTTSVEIENKNINKNNSMFQKFSLQRIKIFNKFINEILLIEIKNFNPWFSFLELSLPIKKSSKYSFLNNTSLLKRIIVDFFKTDIDLKVEYFNNKNKNLKSFRSANKVSITIKCLGYRNSQDLLPGANLSLIKSDKKSSNVDFSCRIIQKGSKKMTGKFKLNLNNNLTEALDFEQLNENYLIKYLYSFKFLSRIIITSKKNTHFHKFFEIKMFSYEILNKFKFVNSSFINSQSIEIIELMKNDGNFFYEPINSDFLFEAVKINPQITVKLLKDFYATCFTNKCNYEIINKINLPIIENFTMFNSNPIPKLELDIQKKSYVITNITKIELHSQFFSLRCKYNNSKIICKNLNKYLTIENLPLRKIRFRIFIENLGFIFVKEFIINDILDQKAILLNGNTGNQGGSIIKAKFSNFRIYNKKKFLKNFTVKVEGKSCTIENYENDILSFKIPNEINFIKITKTVIVSIKFFDFSVDLNLKMSYNLAPKISNLTLIQGLNKKINEKSLLLPIKFILYGEQFSLIKEENKIEIFNKNLNFNSYFISNFNKTYIEGYFFFDYLTNGLINLGEYFFRYINLINGNGNYAPSFNIHLSYSLDLNIKQLSVSGGNLIYFEIQPNISYNLTGKLCVENNRNLCINCSKITYNYCETKAIYLSDLYSKFIDRKLFLIAKVKLKYKDVEFGASDGDYFIYKLNITNIIIETSKKEVLIKGSFKNENFLVYFSNHLMQTAVIGKDKITVNIETFKNLFPGNYVLKIKHKIYGFLTFQSEI